ncbi:Hypothetical protein ABZS17H1_02767 [Kosakonia cowanii]
MANKVITCVKMWRHIFSPVGFLLILLAFMHAKMLTKADT